VDVLTQEQLDSGLSIKEDTDFVYLLDPKGYPVAIFSALGATVKSIRLVADKYLNNT